MDSNIKRLLKDNTDITLRNLGEAIKDATRVSILQLLVNCGPACVTDICDALKIPQPTASHHLALLRMKGFVTQKRTGKKITYSLA